MKKRILVLSVSAWNSKVGYNTWPILLEGNDPDSVANICLRGEIPDSKASNNYFHISENKVIKSIINRSIKTGCRLEAVDTAKTSADLTEHNNRYRKLKKHRSFFTLMVREIVWKLGKWKSPELDRFIVDFNPDVVLYSMDGYIHFNRLCRYAKKISGAKTIGFFADDNFTYKQSRKFGDRAFRFFQRRSLKKLAKNTDAFWAISDMTKKEADAFFGIDCKVLTKPLNRVPTVEYGEIAKPIRMLYTGNLFIGRDRSLLKIVNAIKKLPENSFVIDVYTQTQLSDEKRQAIESGNICRIYAPIPQKEVLEKQKEADVLIFLEDIDGPDAHTARLSFSTKITDYLSSGKCILAVGCEDTAPMQYFIDENAAIVATSEEAIEIKLTELSNDTDLMIKCAQNACDVGIRKHSKEIVLKTFNDTIEQTLKAGN